MSSGSRISRVERKSQREINPIFCKFSRKPHCWLGGGGANTGHLLDPLQLSIFSTVKGSFVRIKITRMHSSRMCTAHSLPYTEGLPDRDPPGQRPSPSVDRQMPVKILPCPKLCLRAVTSVPHVGLLSIGSDINNIGSIPFDSVNELDFALIRSILTAVLCVTTHFIGFSINILIASFQICLYCDKSV